MLSLKSGWYQGCLSGSGASPHKHLTVSAVSLEWNRMASYLPPLVAEVGTEYATEGEREQHIYNIFQVAFPVADISEPGKVLSEVNVVIGGFQQHAGQRKEGYQPGDEENR